MSLLRIGMYVPFVVLLSNQAKKAMECRFSALQFFNPLLVEWFTPKIDYPIFLFYDSNRSPFWLL